jgi:glutamate dehydrogenase/leucine dehydrogenase
MPCTPEAVDVLRKANILIAPAMAAGAGGVRFQFFQFMHNRCALFSMY